MPGVAATAREIRALTHRFPGICAVLLGALTASGFEPFHLWPLALAALGGFVGLLAASASVRVAARCGWLYGLGLFSFGNCWIATAFSYQAAMPGWLGWVGVVLLAAYLAVYPALAAAAAVWLGRGNRLALILALSGAWIVAEWLRSWVFTGFAWNPLAMIALGPFARPGLAAIAPWLGTYALSGLVVLLGGAWFAGAARTLTARRLDWRGAGLMLVPSALMLLPARAPAPATGPAYTLIQPGIREELINDPANYQRQFEISAALSRPDAPGSRLVLWPESGIPDLLRDGYPPQAYLDTYGADPALARARLARAIGPGALLLGGSTDLEFRGQKAAGARNVVTALDDTGTIRASYAKAHLVPYGEYLPMRGLLSPLGLARLVPGEIDFWPGPGPQTLDLGPLGRAGVQICYEIIFSGQVTTLARRPAYLFNPSNDGWFGKIGPPQHLAQARLRAIEEGLPVLRSTTIGISAVIDADGVVRQYLPLGAAGRMDGRVPAAHPPTLFAWLGNMLALLWAVFLLGASMVARRRVER